MKPTPTQRMLHVLKPASLAIFIFSVAVLPSLGRPTAPEVPAVKNVFAQSKMLGRGVNVLGYDPIWYSAGEARFKQSYFKMIHAGGFDTLRVNLNPFRHMGDAPDFALSDSWW